METQAITNNSQPQENRENARLHDACRQFEGLLLGMILKDGMKPGFGMDEDASTGSDIFKDFAIEQTARKLGDAGSFGIADMLYKQMTERTSSSFSLEEWRKNEK